jgi:hypothetical protein
MGREKQCREWPVLDRVHATMHCQRPGVVVKGTQGGRERVSARYPTPAAVSSVTRVHSVRRLVVEASQRAPRLCRRGHVHTNS